ncbi:Sugar-specific transcriptional regulator TrmB [Halobiforma haloterrestris]|uniref:Sugar-specific transcriptional regulator TrmB n=1 Tax=Natronobacterium haloterrestre TaxID=148448 RepID=A0A1I1HU22_NATHA|nr:helix-turn-helix domain-containing protein [Halobiforma haloterrestris]SFC27424.1 Sugar-specific transcriptional regulator TrmB [Halobiforma haloterrestris]
MSNSEEAVRSLTELGLTEYEARCFVALARISSGTAKEISDVAEVPRSRVYDTIERLDRKGLVTVQQSDPREYRAISIDLAIERIRDDYDSRINAAENALQQLERPDSRENEGTWAISRPEYVTDRIVTFLEEADDSIHLVAAAPDSIDREVYADLCDVAEGEPEVVVEVPTEDDREAFHEEVPEATVVVAEELQTTTAVNEERPAKLLLVDGEAVVASGLKESDLPDVVHETAVWTYGRDHGFAAWMRELLDDRLERRDVDR